MTVIEHTHAMDRAKIQLMRKPDSVFFTTLCFSFKHTFDNTIKTACTNGKWIKYSPVFFMGLNAEERVFLVLHEVLHCAYLHMTRRGDRDPRKWNMAADFVINVQLVKRGYKMPKCGLLNHAYDGLSVEQVYDLLPENPKQEVNMDLVEEPGPNAVNDADIQDILVRASMQSKMAGDKPGTIPEDIEIFLNGLLHPKLPWNRILQKYLQAFNKADYSYRKPNRRFFPKYHMPTLYSESLLEIAIAVDASGSVSDNDFKQFVSETHSILRMMSPEKITLIHFDTEIKEVNTIRNVHELTKVKFTGRGGTRIDPVLDWAKQNKPQLLIVFTDGEFRFNHSPIPKNTLWLIHNNLSFTAPAGKVIHYKI